MKNKFVFFIKIFLVLTTLKCGLLTYSTSTESFEESIYISSPAPSSPSPDAPPPIIPPPPVEDDTKKQTELKENQKNEIKNFSNKLYSPTEDRDNDEDYSFSSDKVNTNTKNIAWEIFVQNEIENTNGLNYQPLSYVDNKDDVVANLNFFNSVTDNDVQLEKLYNSLFKNKLDVAIKNIENKDKINKKLVVKELIKNFITSVKAFYKKNLQESELENLENSVKTSLSNLETKLLQKADNDSNF